MSTESGTEDDVREDAELIAAVRGGDAEATGELYERHAGAALVVARRYTDSAADAEDVVADSFTAVFLALQRGNGPDVAFRAYLFTVVRRMAGLQRAKARRAEPTDDVASLEAGTAWAGTAEEPALEGFERGVVARAFHSLPERWQAVLWHTEVEGLQPAQIAPILGLTANGVAALAYRAREGLRQAYLQQHLNDQLDDGCRAVAGKLGSYVRGGLGTRETTQVEQHLETCGECRALVLELSDVNHGMRAVIAPLVLGLAGVGALTHLLPVGGGLAAGAALAGGHGEGVAAGTAAAGAGGAAVAAAGGGTTAASVGGLAAFIASIPATAVAVAAGAVVLAGVATAIVVGILKGPDPAAAPPSSPSASSTLDQPGEATPTPTPSNGTEPTAPTTDPSTIPTTPPTIPAVAPTGAPTSGPTAQPTAQPTDQPTAEPTSQPTAEPTPEPTATPTPEPTSTPTPSPTPTEPPADPAALSVVLPDAGLALEAGAEGQELAIDVANTGGTAATDLSADVVLPDGVTLDGVLTVSTPGVTGRFAAAADPGWVCTAGRASPRAACTLAVLPPKSNATLVLRVSVSEDYEQADGLIELHVVGAGLDFQSAPIPVRVAPAPARLSLVTAPTTLALVTGRERTLSVPLRNAGAVTAPAAAVEVRLPSGVSWPGGNDERWSCSEQAPALARAAGPEVVRCELGAPLAGRAAVGLSLPLVVAEPDAVDGRSIELALTPARGGTALVEVPFSVSLPARLAVSAPEQVEVLGGHTVPVALAVQDVGDLDSGPVTVVETAPKGTSWADVAPDGWSCAVDGQAVTCLRDALAAGASAPLVLGLRADVGSVGALGNLVVASAGDGADEVKDVAVPVVGRAPVLSVSDGASHLLDGGEVQVEFAVNVGDGSDAAGAVARATLPANLTYEASDASSPGCAPGESGRVVECALGDLPAGGSAAVLFHARVRWSDPAARVSVVARSGDVQSEPVRIAVPATSGGLSARFIGSGMAVTEVGAPLLSCDTSTNACRNIVLYGTADNNGTPMNPLDEAPPGDVKRPDVHVSSSTTLGALKGPVAFAGLYWAANKVAADTWSTDPATARLRGPDGTYVSVTSKDVTTATDNVSRQYYQAFVDVTDLVKAQGAGVWSLADAAVAKGRGDRDPTYFAGWSLVVVYADGSRSDVSVYDGGVWVGNGTPPAVFSFAGAAGTRARVGVVAWEGDYRGLGDALTLSTPVCDGPSTALTPLRLGGTLGSSANAFDSTATGWRYPNSLGTDAKGFASVPLTCDVSTLTATTAGDQYLVGAITLRTEPPPDPTSDAGPGSGLAGQQP
ncbi:MAG: sigma-70 family RNA polymerase sigma factor [Brevundimonas sp.]